MSFAKNIGSKYGRKIFDKSIDASNKYGRKILDKSVDASKDFAKIADKKVLHKSAEATEEMIGNKVADRITKSSRNKAHKGDDRIMEETQEIYIPPKKGNKRDLKLET